MLNPEHLSRLAQHSANEDWSAAQEVCTELVRESRGTPDEFNVEELELAVRLRDAERIAVTVKDLIGDLEQDPDESGGSDIEIKMDQFPSSD